jgi:hypothetical protein
MRQRFAILLTCCVVALWHVEAPAQQAADFKGRVTDAGGRSGIENLEVKLTPPRNSNVPIRLGSTDRNGEFVFTRLVRGPYLLEISQGVYLLYRAEVNTARQARVDIALQRRR